MSTPASSTTPVPAVESLQRALTAEHAVIWGYGMVGALLGTDQRPVVQQADAAHRARRDATTSLIRALGGTPATPAASYRLPFPVATTGDALRLAVRLEEGAAAAWRYVVATTDQAKARQAAVPALADAAVRAARWRLQVVPADPTVAFPGQSG